MTKNPTLKYLNLVKFSVAVLMPNLIGLNGEIISYYLGKNPIWQGFVDNINPGSRPAILGRSYSSKSSKSSPSFAITFLLRIK